MPSSSTSSSAADRRSGGRCPTRTDPAFPALAATADDDSRVFTLRRGGLLIAVNFSDVAVTLPDVGSLLFTTPTAATTSADGLTLPPHVGVLMRACTPA